MRIALIHHEFPPIASGIGSYVFDLANNLSKKIDVTVITGNYGPADLVEEYNNLHVYRLSTPSVAPRFVWFQLKNRKKIAEILTKNKIDVLHGQETSSAFLLSDSMFKQPKIVTHHGDPRQDFIQFYKSPLRFKFSREFFQYGAAYPLWYSLSKRCYVQADKVVTFSHFVEHSIQRTFGEKNNIIILPQGIDTKKLLALSNLTVEKDNSIFFSGRLIWRKGIFYLLKAFEQVHSEIPDLKLKIFGQGPLEGAVKNFITNHNLSKSVICYGYVTYQDLIKEICKSYFAVLPSLFEASSILMLEVMACKKPLVAFNLPFLEEQFKHNYDAYLAALDERALAQAIIKLYRDEALRARLSDNGFRNVMLNHDWSKIADQYLEIYENSIAN